MGGLAIDLADDPWPELEAVQANNSALIPLRTLAGAWNRLQKEVLPLAYLEAQVATKMLVRRRTLPKIRKALSDKIPGKSLQAVGQERLSLTDEVFQAQWHERMGLRQAAAGP